MDKKLSFDKMLDAEMKSLIGTRNWNVWKNDIEPEMYNTILMVLYKYGDKKWKEAQLSANKLRTTQKDGRYPISVLTTFKP